MFLKVDLKCLELLYTLRNFSFVVMHYFDMLIQQRILVQTIGWKMKFHTRSFTWNTKYNNKGSILWSTTYKFQIAHDLRLCSIYVCSKPMKTSLPLLSILTVLCCVCDKNWQPIDELLQIRSAQQRTIGRSALSREMRKIVWSRKTPKHG